MLRRTWLLVFRDPVAAGAGVRLARRAEEASALLQAADVQLVQLDQHAVQAVVGRALDPDTPQPLGGRARADQPVTRTPRRS